MTLSFPGAPTNPFTTSGEALVPVPGDRFAVLVSGTSPGDPARIRFEVPVWDLVPTTFVGGLQWNVPHLRLDNYLTLNLASSSFGARAAQGDWLALEVQSAGTRRLVVVDTASHTQRHDVPLAAGPSLTQLVFADQQLLYSTGQGAIHALDLASGATQVVANVQRAGGLLQFVQDLQLHGRTLLVLVGTPNAREIRRFDRRTRAELPAVPLSNSLGITFFNNYEIVSVEGNQALVFSEGVGLSWVDLP